MRAHKHPSPPPSPRGRAGSATLMRGYGGRKRLPDAGELLGIVILAVIGLWGMWFGAQAFLTLFWPLNVVYALAGAVVACISAAVARALLNR